MADLGPTLVTAIAAVSGTLVGGLTSFATSYFTQLRQGHADRIEKDLERREDLYARFNELGFSLAFDALESPLDDPKKLVGIAALAGRIRLASSAEVLNAAEAVIDHLVATYQAPPVDPRVLITKGTRDFLEPMVAFTKACRAERMQMLRGL